MTNGLMVGALLVTKFMGSLVIAQEYISLSFFFFLVFQLINYDGGIIIMREG